MKYRGGTATPPPTGGLTICHRMTCALFVWLANGGASTQPTGGAGMHSAPVGQCKPYMWAGARVEGVEPVAGRTVVKTSPRGCVGCWSRLAIVASRRQRSRGGTTAGHHFKDSAEVHTGGGTGNFGMAGGAKHDQREMAAGWRRICEKMPASVQRGTEAVHCENLI